MNTARFSRRWGPSASDGASRAPDANEIAVVAVQILRPRKQDILVFKMRSPPSDAQMASVQQRLAAAAGFPVPVLYLDLDASVEVIRYEGASKGTGR